MTHLSTRTQVCRWFETLLDYYRMLHPKTHTMDDWSTVMMGNIDNDSRFLSGGGTAARKVSAAGVVCQ